MTREEMLKFCSVCKNRKMDLKRGLVCSLTDDYADFDPVCENYSQDIEEKHRKTVEKEVDKKEREKEIIWRIVPIVLYFIFLCCLLIRSLSTPIYILVILNVAVIAAIVAANILYWRKLKKKRSSDKELTIDKIMDCIRKEGYYPQKSDDGDITFKIQGKTFNVGYKTPFFQVYTKYSVAENYDMRNLLEASSVIMQNMWLIKIFTTVYSDGSDGIIFSVESVITSSKEFENNNLFSTMMNILITGINEHQKQYGQITQEQQNKVETQRQKIGFPVNFSSIKN